MSEACRILHERVNKLARQNSGFSSGNMPINGIYIIFEKGETAYGVDRIVGVGTHKISGTLVERIEEHLYKGDKNRNIFKKHIGSCLLVDDPFFEEWNKKVTSTEGRAEYAKVPEFQKQEVKVRRYIKENFSFAVIGIRNKNERFDIKDKILSTIIASDDCTPSENWLGLKHPDKRIRQGTWNIQGINGDILSAEDLEEFFPEV